MLSFNIALKKIGKLINTLPLVKPSTITVKFALGGSGLVIVK